MPKGHLKKALRTQRALKKGSHEKRSRRIRTSVHFRKPKTYKTPRDPKYPRKAIGKKPKLDHYTVIKHPLATESCINKIELFNCLVFIVDVRSNKTQIKEAIKKLYDIVPIKVNTLIRPDGQKKAYVTLSKDEDALDVANKIGIV